jgi:hypothetical protein
MADVIWIGNARVVAQVDTLTVGGTVEIGDLFIVTINGKDISTAASSTDVDTTASEVAAACNATTEPEFAEITFAASGSGGTLTATSDTAGKPFTLTASTTESGGGAADAQTFVRAATTANDGPNVVNSLDNWSGGALPTGSDDVYIENSAVSLLYELDHFAAVAFSSLTINKSFTGYIGLPERVVGSSSSYNEYRPTYFQLAATTLRIGEGAGIGSGRLKFDFGSNQMTATVFGTGTAIEAGIPSCLLKSTHASAAATVEDGNVGIAALSGETSTIALTQRGGSVRLGNGVTVKAVDNIGGSLIADRVTQTGSALLTLR